MVAAVSLLLAILFVPLIEVFLFIQVGSEIGALPTVALCVLTAVAGAAMLRHQGLKALTEARARLNRNEAPVDQVFDGLFLGLAAVLLMVPGFFTDAIGALLLVPAFRRLMQRQILARTRFVMTGRPGPGQPGSQWRSRDGSVIIEGEYSAPADRPGPADGRRRPEDDEPPLIGR
ncbi:FxsA family protein [Tistrella mobilis]|uniref:FxsA n=1 Tax=Tistrella mobilis (strain KA081020-065) TaxID=1110502 RepID=I3TR45_TISMK|nr:FxsA family protein [Tistrella mobilis]AFK55233.1 FxsA [Tistrella mobilis KA081020-065]MAM75120.1 exlusion protein FxsA [Tistrella sp.]